MSTYQTTDGIISLIDEQLTVSLTPHHQNPKLEDAYKTLLGWSLRQEPGEITDQQGRYLDDAIAYLSEHGRMHVEQYLETAFAETYGSTYTRPPTTSEVEREETDWQELPICGSDPSQS